MILQGVAEDGLAPYGETVVGQLSVTKHFQARAS
jgi:hypothetical protein